MTPAARLQAAIEILGEIAASGRAADRVLEAWGRHNRFAGAKDRGAIAARVFSVLRRRAECAFAAQGDTPRDWVLGALSLDDGLGVEAIAALLDGTGYGPPALTAEERRRLAAPRPPPPAQVRLNVPDWLLPALAAGLGAGLEREMAALQGRAPLDLRVNTLKATRAEVAAALSAEGVATVPLPLPPAALRVGEGEGASPRPPKLGLTAVFREGLVEVQDAGSQIAAALAGARGGETWIDLAAGAGGKALALAAHMGNAGRILALDADARRLAELPPRAARAGATCIAVEAGFGRARDALPEADGVLVDAPCSGTGTWRRNPEARWSLTEDKLRGYLCAQDALLRTAAAQVRPGGRIVYVTCSLLPQENAERIAGLCADAPGLAIVPAGDAWRERFGRAPPPGVDRFAQLTPAAHATDGFFIAILTRRADGP